MSVVGKTALVFGGARGIGQACVERLLQEGAKVCIADIRAELGAATCQTLLKSHPDCVFFKQCDVTKDDQVISAFCASEERFGDVNICVVTAGICDEVNWRRTLQINLESSVAITYIAYERMGTHRGKKGGHVILLSSVSGILVKKYSPVYSASKSALLGFVRSFGTEDNYEHCGLRLNAICPNLVKTDLLAEISWHPRLKKEDYEERMKVLESSVMPASDVANAMMKAVREQLTGATLAFSRLGIEVLNHDERYEDFEKRQ